MDRREIATQIEFDPAAVYAAHTGQPIWGERLDMLPSHMRRGLVRYILLGTVTGGFLSATLSGDLFEAVRRADDANHEALLRYPIFLFNYAPLGCFGSAGKVRDWIAAGGLVGFEPEAA